MRVYVETNFILELVYEQEEARACERIIELAEQRRITLVVPAFSLVEPHDTLSRDRTNRKEIQDRLRRELKESRRSSLRQAVVPLMEEVVAALTRNNEQELDRFEELRRRMLNTAEVVALSGAVVRDAARIVADGDLEPQDAVVLASVLFDLTQAAQDASCFLNRNKWDFDVSSISGGLAHYDCRLILSFEDGLKYLESLLR